MRLFSLLIVFVIVFSGPAFAQARFPFTGETTADRVNVRAGQNNNFESVAILPKGALVGVLSKSFKWYKVFLPSGAKAFVKSEYVKLLTPELGEVIVDHLNVRSGPNTEATTIGQLTQGQKLLIQQNKDGWLWIKPVNGIYGWVHESLVVFKKNGFMPNSEADPNTADVVKASNSSLLKTQKPVKSSWLNQAVDGTVECVGNLQKPEVLSDGYKVTRDNSVVCFVDGPHNVLDGFVGSDVRVKGRLKGAVNSDGIGIVTLLKISLVL